MERRRVAPGWLDVEQKMLVPERKEQAHASSAIAAPSNQNFMDVDPPKEPDGGEELDRAFGGLGLR
jgi:hypothetical protein